jgi:hypothetical protein
MTFLPIHPEVIYRARDLGKVRALCEHLASPQWMPNPGAWLWTRPDGNPQGFGMLAYTSPGMANLLWLAMDMDEPPSRYDTRANPLYQMVITDAAAAKLAGQPLVDLASVLPLSAFADKLSDVPLGHGIEQMYPLLRALAQRRLHHANP